MYDFSHLPVIDNHTHPYLFETDPERYSPLNSFLGVHGEGERSPEALAHRRLPSRMTPTWRGIGASRSWATNRFSYAR